MNVRYRVRTQPNESTELRAILAGGKQAYESSSEPKICGCRLPATKRFARRRWRERLELVSGPSELVEHMRAGGAPERRDESPDAERKITAKERRPCWRRPLLKPHQRQYGPWDAQDAGRPIGLNSPKHKSLSPETFSAAPWRRK